MRDEQVRRATKHAFRNAKRPRRAKLLMVPTAEGIANQQAGGFDMFGRKLPFTHRATVVPFTPTPISWAEARKRGRATGRVLEGPHWHGVPLPKWPNAEEQLALTALADRLTSMRKARANSPKIERYSRDPKGEWWQNKMADILDRRNAARKGPQPVVEGGESPLSE